MSCLDFGVWTSPGQCRKSDCELFGQCRKSELCNKVGIRFFFFFDEPVTILKKGETELQRPPGLFQNDGRETSRAISKIKRTKEITRKRPFC